MFALALFNLFAGLPNKRNSYKILKFNSLFQIVLNNLLEEQLAEERVNKKDKTGNGLKCKNRSRLIQTTTANPTQTGSPDQVF